MRILDADDLVTTVVHPLEVGGRGKVKSELQSVVGRVKLHQVLDRAERRQINDVVA